MIDVAITSQAIRYASRSARLVLAIDITRQARAEETIAYLAHHDALTGLANRVGLATAIAPLLTGDIGSDGVGALLFVDLDGFKRINDELGHVAGDAVLQTVADRVQASVRPGDAVARLGGDEFVVVVRADVTSDDVAGLVARVRGAIREPFLVEGHTLRIDSSIGASYYPRDGTTFEELLRVADATMYREKHARRGHSA